MESYVRFNNAASPQNSREASMRRQQYEADSGSSSDPQSPQLPLNGPPASRTSSWFAATSQSVWRWLKPPAPTPYESQYLTLIPLSDARLRPRHTKLIVSSLLLLAVIAVVGVFLMVPRGVSVGSIDVHSTKMTFNATTLTYRIILQADVPIFNPNYLKVTVHGNMSVSFFDAEAGWSPVGPVTLAARMEPSVLAVKVDASNLPRKYTQVVYTHCFNFPRKLIFFLLGNFQASYLGYTTQLPSIDTYFMLDCSGAKQAAPPPQHSSQAATTPAAAAAASGLAAAATSSAKHPLLPPPQQQQGWEQDVVAADGWDVSSTGGWPGGQMRDWELEVYGTVPVHPSSSSSSSSSQDSSHAGLQQLQWTRLLQQQWQRQQR